MFFAAAFDDSSMAAWLERRVYAALPSSCTSLRARSSAARCQSTYGRVVDRAKATLLGSGESGQAAVDALTRDPLAVVGKDLSVLRNSITSLLGSERPSLDRIAKYYFQAEGKHVRPMIVLLISKATNGLSAAWGAERAANVGEGVNTSISPATVLNDYNPDAATPHAPRAQQPPAKYEPTLANVILPTQRRLAEITEMIHVASLLHDDVIDASDQRRGEPSAPARFGNKLSILGGDFLLGRASIALARLRDPEVVELMSTVIANLVEGEVMQMRAASSEQVPITDVQSSLPNQFVLQAFWTDTEMDAHAKGNSRGPTPEIFQHYLQKTYLKTASLIAKSARSAAVLGGCSAEAVARSGYSAAEQEEACRLCDAAYQYGRNVGIAFQLVDDLLDFKSSSEAFGKPSGGADLRLGLATAPALYAWKQFPDSSLGTLVARNFSHEGDVAEAMELILRSDGLERTAQLARYHSELANATLAQLPPSDARDALATLNEHIVTRIK